MRETSTMAVFLFAFEATVIVCAFFSPGFARGLAWLLKTHADAWELAWKTYRNVWNGQQLYLVRRIENGDMEICDSTIQGRQ